MKKKKKSCLKCSFSDSSVAQLHASIASLSIVPQAIYRHGICFTQRNSIISFKEHNFYLSDWSNSKGQSFFMTVLSAVKFST